MMKVFIRRSFLPLTVPSSLLVPNIILFSTLSSKTLESRFSFRARDEVSHPETTGTIVVLYTGI